MITFGWADHLFAVLGLLIVVPVFGDWAWRRLKRRLAEEGRAALIREYRMTVAFQVLLAGLTLAIWLGAGRPIEWLGFAPPHGAYDEIAGAVTMGATAGLVIRPVLTALTTRMDAALLRALESVRELLPVAPVELAWALLVSLGAGIAEEIAYRGFLQPWFGAWLSPWAAIAAASIVFGLAHLYQGVKGVLVTAILGGALGTLFWATQSLWYPIALHALVDVSTMITAYIVLRRASPVTAAPASL